MLIVWTEGARLDLAEGEAWASKHWLGGEAFVKEILEALRWIFDLPYSSPPVGIFPNLRARTLRRIRYRVVYEVDGQTIRLIAIAHTSRDPNYWLDRLK